MKEIIYYVTSTGKCPFTDWLEDLSPVFQAKIFTRLDRLAEGNKGDWKHLENSALEELRLHFGSGYRIYFKELSNVIVLVVAGSDKSSQVRTIKKANLYFEDYLKRNTTNDD